MGRSVCLFFMIMTCAAFAFGQSAVFVNKANGNFGIGYNIDGMAEEDGSPTSLQNLRIIAKGLCGGTGCEFLSESKVDGWLALISGHTAAGKVLFAVSEGNAIKDSAEADVRKKYKADGGTDADKIEVVTVYVYNTAYKKDSIEVKGFEAVAKDEKALDNLFHPKIAGGGAGKSAGASYDPSEPRYEVTKSNVKAVQAEYMRMIVTMTSAPETKAKLLKDHNDLQSYMELERKSEKPLVDLRKSFIKYLHITYGIPYPPQ